jgi:hypothetical protein
MKKQKPRLENKKKRHAEKHRLTTVGYYSHQEGARYLSPVHLRSEFPELVELHELQHEYLALGNATDTIARLYSRVLEREEGKLRPEHRSHITSLLKTITRQTVFVHETVATYISFLIFKIHSPERVARARRLLPRDYVEALTAGERAFGQISDPRTISEHKKIYTPVLTAAVAALNPPYHSALLRFDRLHECAKFIEINSPNRRFRHLLHDLRPHWQGAGVLSNLIASQDVGHIDAKVYQKQVFDCLREHFPKISFIVVDERFTYLREMATELVQSGVASGYDFVQGLDQLAPVPDTVLDWFRVKLKQPGPDSDAPLDLTLLQKEYRSFGSEVLNVMTRKLENHDICLTGHVNMVDGDLTARMFCYWLRHTDRFDPTYVECNVEELLKMLNRSKTANIFVKVDDRIPTNVSRAIQSTGHVLLVLVHDSSPAYAARVIVENSHGDLVGFYIHLRKDRSFSVLVARTDENVFYLVPVTNLSGTVVEEHLLSNGFRSVADKSAIMEMFGSKYRFLLPIVYDCFMGEMRERDIA